MAYEPIAVADCSKPRGEQVTTRDLTRDEMDARDAQRAAAEAREQVQRDAEAAEAAALQADIDALDTALTEAEVRAILKRRLLGVQATREGGRVV
jgi:hypothetical protein